MTIASHQLGPQTSVSAVSWGAILAGALAAGLLALLLFILGIGLGFSSVSIWSGEGISAAALGWSAIAWLVITQLASAAMGGYMAGRLRTKWQGLNTDESYFRDTAHGFLSWCVATIVMFVLAGSVLGSLVSGTTKAVGAVVSQTAEVAASTVGTAASAATTAAATAGIGAAASQVVDGLSMDDLNYWINSLMRNNGLTDQQAQNLKDEARQLASRVETKAEDVRDITGVFTHALRKGELAEADAAHVARLVARHTDLSTSEAQQRVKETFAQIQQAIAQAQQALKDAAEAAKQAAETARKTAAHSMLWVFVVLLVGAFIGGLSATIGGRQRDSF